MARGQMVRRLDARTAGSLGLPCEAVRAIMRPALAPCSEFEGTCRDSMRWAPEQGHIPRGCCGALAGAEDVRVIMVVAEPGDPHPDEHYPAAATPDDYLARCTAHAFRCFAHGRDRYHANARAFLDLCFPGMAFSEQLRHAWITESCLCSAAKECGHVPAGVAQRCAERYLAPQLRLFRGAAVVAFGAKAQARLRALGIACIDAGALAPPGCNRQEARQSWAAAAARVQECGWRNTAAKR